MDTKRKIIPYNPALTKLARQLRNSSTQSEIKLWKALKGKSIYGYDFHRQKPIDNYIADSFCHELMLCIELDGYSHQLEETYLKDTDKEKRLNELGVTVLRFQDKEVMGNLNGILRIIENYILEKERHTPDPSREGKYRVAFLKTE